MQDFIVNTVVLVFLRTQKVDFKKLTKHVKIGKINYKVSGSMNIPFE